MLVLTIIKKWTISGHFSVMYKKISRKLDTLRVNVAQKMSNANREKTVYFGSKSSIFLKFQSFVTTFEKK